MRFNYCYRDKANARQSGVVDAKDRDAAFRLLHAKGIRPYSLEASPGVFNNLFGRGKRWLAIAVLGVACLALTAVALFFRDEARDIRLDAESSPRHQIYGDPALMEDFERTDFAVVFAHPGERILARYAQPGCLIASGKACNLLRGRSRAQLPAAATSEEGAALFACLTNRIVFSKDDPREVTELKQIVNWMKGELGRYLANGVGTPDRYLLRLGKRQEYEAQLYFTAKHDLEKETDPAKFERVNASLRVVGLKTIPPPAPQPEQED